MRRHYGDADRGSLTYPLELAAGIWVAYNQPDRRK
jgi:hypothetical protein